VVQNLDVVDLQHVAASGAAPEAAGISIRRTPHPTAAATALFGVITDPRDLGPREPKIPVATMDPTVDDRNIIPPAPPDLARTIVIARGPNIQPPPRQVPISDRLEGDVLIKLDDNVSTGDLSPDGATVMAYRSNVPAIAEFTFQHRDKQFARRAKEWASGRKSR
jgi:aconitate hydratase